MDAHTLLRLTHVFGFLLLGGGLLAVFVSELRAYATRDVARFAEAAWYTAVFYEALVLPGALAVGASGVLLVRELGLGFFGAPWLVGMWGLFAFEFVEGNTVTHMKFRRTLRRSRVALERGHLGESDRAEARSALGRFAHFLDLPLFAAMVAFGVARPASWGPVLATIALCVAAAAVLSVSVPRLLRGDAQGVDPLREH